MITLADDGVRLWRTSAHARFWALAQPTGIEPLSGERLAVIAARDPTIHVVDASRTEMMRVTGHAGPVHGLAGSPGGSRLLSWSADGSVRTWRSDLLGAHDGERVPRGRVDRAVVLDGDRLLTGHALGHIVLTSTSPREECWSAVEPGLDGLAVAADVVAAWSRDRVCIRNLVDGSVAAVRNIEPLGPTVPGRDMLALSRSRLADVGDAAVWRMDTGELVATLAVPGGRWAGAAWLPHGDAVLWSEAGELFRWARTSTRLAEVPLGGRGVLDVIPVGARIAAVTNEGPLWVALSTLAEPPVVFADDIEGAMALSDSRLVCWTAAGDIHISSARGDSVERAVPGRGHRLAWTARTPTGMVAIEDDGVARYVSRSTTASVHDVPVCPDCVMVSADESLLAVSRNNGVDILGLPSLEAIARWQADGHVRIHGVTHDHRFVISTPDGSVDVLEVGPAR